MSLQVIFLPSLCEFHGLIWLFKSSLAGEKVPVSSWMAVLCLPFHRSLLVEASLKSAFYPQPLLICWCFFFPPVLFSSLVLSTREVYIYYIVYSRHFSSSLAGNAASGVVLASLQITFNLPLATNHCHFPLSAVEQFEPGFA